MTIEPNKVLTISLRDYCESRGKEISDYVIEGVHSFGTIGRDSEIADSPKHQLASQVPEGVEAVVGYGVQFMNQFERLYDRGVVFYEANGNALVPKKE